MTGTRPGCGTDHDGNVRWGPGRKGPGGFPGWVREAARLVRPAELTVGQPSFSATFSGTDELLAARSAAFAALTPARASSSDG
jgi:hypothetical protein